VRAASAALAAFALCLGGCMSAPRTYENTLPKNLMVRTKVDGGGVKAAAAFDIYRVNADCSTDFEGRVNLENGATEVGLPGGAPLYLDFVFVTGGGFTSSVGAVRHGTLLITRAGHDYRAEVTYAKGIYSVEIREARKGAGSRVVERVPLTACKARS
jgi:hypothetical protein